MKTALIAAVVAAIVAAGSAGASSWINGRSIRPHSIPLNRLAHKLTVSPHLQFTRVVGEQRAVAPGSYGLGDAECPNGQQAIAGGFLVIAQVDGGQIVGLGSWPLDNLTGWATEFQNYGTTAATVQAYAVCVP